MPTAQSWAQGQYRAGDFLIALLLCIVLIGFLVFAYMLIVKPAGTLTVTYTRNADESADELDALRTGTLSDRLSQLGAARDAGLITPEEYEERRRSILEST